MGRREEPAWAKGTVGLTMARERGDIQRQFQNRLTVTRDTIDRLGLENTLHGHMGCVNCLEWNADGSVLASASDDLHVILWDPFSYKKLQRITTGHTGNIFSVKFLTEDTVATCAADGVVRARSVLAGASLLECACHCGRVKRLAAAPDAQHLLWSAGEDGFILQHDLRTNHRCNAESNNVVVNLLSHLGRYAEAKCVAVNPRRPHQLAVGANDFYVRLYDTRMVRPTSLSSTGAGARGAWERQGLRCARAGAGDPASEVPPGAVHYFAPGHLTIEPNEQTFPKKAATYVAFSHDGNELLVNLGSEQVYLFDINSSSSPQLVESFIRSTPTPDEGERRNGTVPPELPARVRHLKDLANEHVNKSNYTAAIRLYNHAIAACPDCAILYSNRAAALMRRQWAGDTYAAVRDCYRAVRLDASHVKSHFRLAKGLMDLKKPKEAMECLNYFKEKFPKQAKSHAVFLLEKDIKVALDEPDPQIQSEEAAAAVSESPLPEGRAGAGTGAAERARRAAARDYDQRFLGHCNTTTDIKEANFLGPDATYVAAGSDDGSLFIWCRKTGNIVRCLRGDESIVNCVQMHPSMFLLASSGIETVVRLWSPRPEDGNEETRVVTDPYAAACANQQRMRSDPFEAMLLNISFAGGPDRDLHSPHCRTT